MSEYPPILQCSHVAELVGLKTAESARDWIRTEGVPHIQTGRRVLVLLSTLLRWLQEREQARPEDDGAGPPPRRRPRSPLARAVRLMDARSRRD